MTRRLLTLSMFLVLVALHASLARASSVYAIGGLGEPILEEGARVRAMGGAGAADFGPDRFSLVNPASTAGVQHLLLQGTFLPTWRHVSDGNTGESARETTIPSLRGLIRMPAGIVLGAAYVRGTDAAFRLERTETAGAPSSLQVEGSGGLQLIRITASRALSPRLRLGVDHEIIAGDFREEWTRTFADPLLERSRDTLEVRYDRLGRWRIGAQGTVGSWTIGGVVETPRRLPVRYLERAAGTSTVTSPGALTVPGGFTAGLAGPIGGRWSMAAQYRRADWKRSSLASDLVDFRALQRVSIGFERRGAPEVSSGWRARLPLRFGASYLQWPDLLPVAGAGTIAGGVAGVSEWTVSIGTGFATQDRAGAVDLSLEAGTRGNRDRSGVDERFVRAAVTLQISDDTWK